MAVERSERWELLKRRPRCPQKPALSDQEVREIAQAVIIEAAEWDPAQVAGHCVMLAGMLHFRLLEAVGMSTEPWITIGDVFLEETTHYKVTENSLQRNLDQGQQPRGVTLNVHVWLTMPDFAVVDLTLLTSLLVHDDSRADLWPSNSSPVIVWRESTLEPYCRFRYQPLLVGAGFLRRTIGRAEIDEILHAHIPGWQSD